MGTYRDKVAIIGAGCARSGERWECNAEDLLVEACAEALGDAGIGSADIQAGVLGTLWSGGAGTLAHAVKLEYVPVTHVSNACATGSDAFRVGAAYVAAGLYDVVLVAGVEKQKDTGLTGQQGGGGASTQTSLQGLATPPGVFAPLVPRYAHQYGYSMEELKRALARIAVKNHRHGALNPKAWFRKEITIEDVLQSPWIAWPLNLYDCCVVADGAAAVVLTRPELAAQFRNDYVVLKGMGMAMGARQGQLQAGSGYTNMEENIRAARVAYDQAGIKDPLRELCMGEVHDAFTIVELLSLEDVGLAPRGQGPRYVMDGVFDLEGECPVNTNGGLKSCGHPVGATGLNMVYEVYKQLQGKAGARQVKNPSLALVHNQGSAPGEVACNVAVFSSRD